MKISWLKKICQPEKIFLLLIILFIFTLALQLPVDPDMGWHLKNGEYLLNHNWQIPQFDIYSYTMPTFPLIMHEWLTDIIMFFLYHQLGYFSLMILFAVISGLAFFLVAKSVKAKLSYQLIASLMGVIACLPIISVRAQMITLLGLALCIYIIYRFKSSPGDKMIYFLPLIILAWANLHGGFTIGLFFIGLFTGIELIKLIAKKGLQKYLASLAESRRAKNFNYQTLALPQIGKLAAVFLISVLTTIINPYGFRIYHEIFTTVFDNYAKSFIGEWFPLTVASPMSHLFLVYAFFMLFLIFFSLKKIDFTYLIISIVFFIISISSWRNLPFFILITIPYWIYLVEFLTGDKLQTIVKRKEILAVLAMVLFFLIFQKIPKFIETVNSEKLLAETSSYPYAAVEFLKNHPQAGNMLNEYNWGGYLIWHYPEKKVFIDGRMASWRQNLPNGETVEILKDFRMITGLSDGWDKLLEKYQIKFALIYKRTYLDEAFQAIKWNKVYEDGLAVIYVRE